MMTVRFSYNNAFCGSQGIPGRDGKDGTQGLDGEKVIVFCLDTSRLSFSVSNNSDADSVCLCSQGDAGRPGVPGEKGPNGLPVRITITLLKS